MKKKEKHIAILSFIFSIFLFLWMVINFATGHIGGAMGNFGSSIFFLSLSFTAYEKKQKGKG